MEYVYAALLLHNAGKEITEATITAILQAAGVEVDAARAKALVASLEGINIKEAIEKAAFAAPAAAAAAPVAETVKAEAPAEEAAAKTAAEEEEEAEESGMEGLGALFG